MNKARQLGFTTDFSIESAWATIYEPASEIVVLSKTEKEAKKFMNKFYLAMQDAYTKDDNTPKPTVENKGYAEYANGANITVMTSSKGAGRSFSLTRGYFDEMPHAMYADDIYQGLIPTVSVTGGKITLFSTPLGTGNKFAEIGEDPDDFGYVGFAFPWWFSPFYNQYYDEFIKAHLAGEPTDKIIDRARTAPKFKALRKSFKGSNLGFQQEYECRYDSSVGQVFNTTQLRKVFRPSTEIKLKHVEDYPYTEELWTFHPTNGHEYVTAVDLGRKRDATVIVTFDITEKPAKMVEYKRIPPATADWHIINLAIRDTYAKFKPEMVHDATSMSGDAVSEMLIDISDPEVINNNVARTGKKYNLIENVRRGIDNGVFIMPKIKQLHREFKRYQWDDKKIVQDSVIAVALAVAVFYEPENYWVGAERSAFAQQEL